MTKAADTGRGRGIGGCAIDLLNQEAAEEEEVDCRGDERGKEACAQGLGGVAAGPSAAGEKAQEEEEAADNGRSFYAGEVEDEEDAPHGERDAEAEGEGPAGGRGG